MDMKIIIRSIPIVLTIVFFGLLAKSHAVNPPPDGGYPGGNTAEGQAALLSLTSGGFNTAVGWLSLRSNIEGAFNTATGAGTLLANTAGGNTATGAAALLSNTIGFNNTANGGFALFENNAGSGNTADGASALGSNSTGNQNTAIGLGALFGNTFGNNNTAIGYQALAINTTGSSNTALGFAAGNGVTAANNVIAIGAPGANVNNSCFIGNIYSNVQPIVGTDPDSVTITSTGRLGRGNVSSRRYKHDIKPMEKASEVLYALKPVSFRYNKEYEATQTLAFGLIAEEVAEVYPDLVGRNPEGEPESVRYEQVNAMLLNEFLKEHRKVQQQEATIAELKKGMETLVARSKEQEAKIQRVTDQIEMSRPAPQMASNRQ